MSNTKFKDGREKYTPELSRTDTGIFWIVQDGADLLRPPGTDQSFILLLDRKFIDIAKQLAGGSTGSWWWIFVPFH